MPGAIPVINGSASGVIPSAGTPGDAYPGGAPQLARPTGVQAPFSGEHNTAAQVGLLIVIALGGIALLQMAGFRFVVDAGIGGR